jgi:hypothetical protein
VGWGVRGGGGGGGTTTLWVGVGGDELVERAAVGSRVGPARFGTLET